MESSDDFSKIFHKILFYFFQKSLRIPSHVFKSLHLGAPGILQLQYWMNSDFTAKGELFLFTVRIFSWIPRFTVAFERNSRRVEPRCIDLLPSPVWKPPLEGCVKGWWKESKDKELNHSRWQRKADAGK